MTYIHCLLLVTVSDCFVGLFLLVRCVIVIVIVILDKVRKNLLFLRKQNKQLLDVAFMTQATLTYNQIRTFEYYNLIACEIPLWHDRLIE